MTRRRRRRRLRTTAVPTGRPMAKATAGGPSAATQVTCTARRRDRTPRVRRLANAARPRTRSVRIGRDPFLPSGREAEAALLTARTEHRPPGLRGHAVAEPVAGGPPGG